MDEKTPAEDVYVVQVADGNGGFKLVPHTVAQPAELVVEREFTPLQAAVMGSNDPLLAQMLRID